MSNELNLVLLPGLHGTKTLFPPFINEFYVQVNITVIDYPIHDKLNYDQLVELVLSKLTGVDNLVILAESFSGPIGIKIAGKLGNRLKGIIFCATFAKPPRPFLLSLTKVLPIAYLFKTILAQTVIKYWHRRYSAPDYVRELLQEAHREMDYNVIAYRLKSIRDCDVSELLKNIEVPCCYIQAKKDDLVLKKSLKPFVENVRTIQLYEVEGPHFILQSNPYDCYKVVCDFLMKL